MKFCLDKTKTKRYFLILLSDGKDSGTVVAFAVGSRCTSPELIDDDGMALVDCHAIPLVRRALLK